MVKNHNKLSINPFRFFLIAGLITILLSGILSFFDLQTTGLTVQTSLNDVDSYVIAIESLLNGDGIRYVIGNAITNFVSFAPLGSIIIALVAIGVAQKTGFLKTFFTVITNKFPKKFLTFLVFLISLLGAVYIDGAYALLMPLSAILFMTNERNPIIGVIASFAGTAGGYGITALVGALDSSLSAYTSIAARLLDVNYGVTIWSNIFIMIVGSLVITYVGMEVTEKIIVPKVGRAKFEEEELFVFGKLEKKGLIYALISLIIMIAIVCYMVIPGLPLSGVLLDSTARNYVNQLHGSGSSFYKGGVLIFSTLILISGLIYGLVVGTFKKDQNIIKGTADELGNILILLFVAAQFIAIFKVTNIGPFITGVLTNFIGDLSFTGLPLILLFLFIVMISNLFFTSPVSKWAIMSPVIVPLFMQANISPEFTQMIFRAGQSITNGVTPLLAYFVVFVALVDRYNTNKDKHATVFGCMKYTVPYSLAFCATWILLLLAFYIIGIPLGQNSMPTF